ncbi:ATP-binding protein [Streptomyces chattanoogensis]|uniref:ATP-binding protein n=1 Tax=Streptomyces chattanoogensis TaxID=66876 RepID=UPI003692B4CD
MIAPHHQPQPERALTPAPEPVLQHDALDYAPRPKSIALARNRAACLAADWGHPELADDTCLLVSELATNALVRGAVPGRLFRVRLSLTRAVLQIAVTDARGERLPHTGEPTPNATSGRGLLLVRALCLRWGVHVLDVGKTVWCELDVTRGGRLGMNKGPKTISWAPLRR